MGPISTPSPLPMGIASASLYGMLSRVCLVPLLGLNEDNLGVRVVVSLEHRGYGLGHLAGRHHSALCDLRTFSLSFLPGRSS